jgi:hypothetical protein
MRLVAKAKASSIGWKDTHACSFTKYEPILAFVRWCSTIGVTAQSGDFCQKGSWVFARDSEVNIQQCYWLSNLCLPEQSGCGTYPGTAGAGEVS